MKNTIIALADHIPHKSDRSELDALRTKVAELEERVRHLETRIGWLTMDPLDVIQKSVAEVLQIDLELLRRSVHGPTKAGLARKFSMSLSAQLSKEKFITIAAKHGQNSHTSVTNAMGRMLAAAFFICCIV